MWDEGLLAQHKPHHPGLEDVYERSATRTADKVIEHEVMLDEEIKRERERGGTGERRGREREKKGEKVVTDFSQAFLLLFFNPPPPLPPSLCLFSLRAVFTRLRESSLKMKPRKCSFTMEQLRYLGHLVSADGLTVDPRKVEAVRELATPSNRSLRSFLGLASYYRKYIAGHADMAAPLTTMHGENQLFK